jgi:hypothetical protein
LHTITNTRCTITPENQITREPRQEQHRTRKIQATNSDTDWENLLIEK